MPRAVWRGTVSFGLVTVQVRLYPAVKRRGVRFRELDRRTGQRVRHQRVRPATTEQEPDEDEFAPAWQPPAGDQTPADPESPERAREGAPAPSAQRSSDGTDEDDRDAAVQLRPAEPRRPPEPGAASEPARDPRPVPGAEARRESEVRRDELVRGYEYSPGQYVGVTEEELAELAPERTRTIDVEQFVSRSALDPVSFDTSYYVVPDGSTRPFAVLLRAMQETNRAAICWIVLRSRRHLAALQPRGDLMLLTTLLFSDEVVPVDRLRPILPDDVQERETEMAELLLSTLAGPWEPERYRDEYREKVMALVEGRAAAEEFVQETEHARPPAAGVDELLAALKASVEEARAQRREREPRPVRRRRGA